MSLRQKLDAYSSRITYSWAPHASSPSAIDDFWYAPVGSTPAAGVRVNADLAQQITTVSACVKLISEAVASVPLMIYREIPAGKERANDLPLSIKLRRKPNRWQTSLAWREMMTGHAALRGKAYSEMVGRTFDDLELIPRHPDRVRTLDTDDAGFTTVYGIRDVKSGIERAVPASKMFCLQGPWGGRSPVEVHREAIGLGLAMQEHAARYFGNGSRPGGVLQTRDGSQPMTPEQRVLLKASWEDAHKGPANSNRVAVLEGGLEWKQVGLSDKDSQFLEQRLFHVADLCRIWNVPPYKVQEYGRATWANTEQQSIEFLTTCMLPWYRRWEEAISWYLIEDGEPIFAEFLLEGLLRGDTQTRYAAYTIALGGKAFMSQNEVRELENRNRMEGLDEIDTVAQGIPQPGQPQKKPPQKPTQNPDDQQVVWRAWVETTAESLVRAENREYGNAPKDPKAEGDYMRAWYLGKYTTLVRAKLEPMRPVWRATLPIDAAISVIVTQGVEVIVGERGIPERKMAILAVLSQGADYAVAA